MAVRLAVLAPPHLKGLLPLPPRILNRPLLRVHTHALLQARRYALPDHMAPPGHLHHTRQGAAVGLG